jgi:hypothetical protein
MGHTFGSPSALPFLYLLNGQLPNPSHNKPADSPHHSGQVLHNLFIPKADNPQPHLSQSLFPSRIFFLLQIMDVSIHFNDQPCLVTVKINDEPRNDLLSPKMDSQLIPAQLLPKEQG